MKMTSISCILAASLMFLRFSPAGAGVSEKMLTKGALPESTDGVRQPRSDQVFMTFGIYDDAGVMLWSEQH
jgi:hypothetical protein